MFVNLIVVLCMRQQNMFVCLFMFVLSVFYVLLVLLLLLFVCLFCLFFLCLLFIIIIFLFTLFFAYFPIKVVLKPACLLAAGGGLRQAQPLAQHLVLGAERPRLAPALRRRARGGEQADRQTDK